ncbi:MAG: hypothetical protein HY390_00900 [Deltaproteobacteria bacterium]|nr:hypothetical protein [Deltaproteobacteria bacterium]
MFKKGLILIIGSICFGLSFSVCAAAYTLELDIRYQKERLNQSLTLNDQEKKEVSAGPFKFLFKVQKESTLKAAVAIDVFKGKERLASHELSAHYNKSELVHTKSGTDHIVLFFVLLKK